MICLHPGIISRSPPKLQVEVSSMGWIHHQGPFPNRDSRWLSFRTSQSRSSLDINWFYIYMVSFVNESFEPITKVKLLAKHHDSRTLLRGEKPSACWPAWLWLSHQSHSSQRWKERLSTAACPAKALLANVPPSLGQPQCNQARRKSFVSLTRRKP